MNVLTLEAVSNWLLRTSVEASVLILAVLGVRMILGKRLGPGWRTGLWLLVIVKLLLPACIPLGFGLGEIWAQGGGQVVSAQEATAMAATEERAILGAVPASEAPRSKMVEVGVVEGAISWNSIWLGAWLLGGALVFGVAVLRQRQFERALNQRPLAQDAELLRLVAEMAKLAGVRKTLPVVLMPGGATPAVVGCMRPRLLLPEDWPARFNEAGLRHVLLHEILHVRHRDLWWNWVSVAVQALHWFNPLVWLVAARFQADRELRCDASALARLSPNERFAYGNTLLRIQQTFFPPQAIAGLAPCVRNHPTLRQRIAMIAEPHRQRPLLHALFAATFGLISCYAFTTARAAEEEKPLPPEERSRETTRGGGGETGDSRSDGDGVKKGPRDGEGERKGPRDGEGKKSGMREGHRPKEGKRDGDRPKEGERDGERPKGAERDGDRPRTGPRDGERPAIREGDGKRERGAEGAAAMSIHVLPGGEAVRIGDEEVPMNRLRGFLSRYVPEHPGLKIEIVGDKDTPYKVAMEVMDAVRDNGVKDVSLRGK